MKYFYTDPLQAAYMAKHFGMDFYSDAGCERKPRLGVYGEQPLWIIGHRMVSENIIGVKWDKFYIHPDSLKLLAPQPGDFGLDDFGNQCFVNNDREWTPHIYENRGEKLYNPRTIYRGGKPFFWPESENAS